MTMFAKARFALALAGAMALGIMPAHSQEIRIVKMTITECWNIPLTSWKVCSTREVWVAAHLVDEVLSGELNP